MQLPGELMKYLQPLQHWWQGRAPREQQVLQLLALVLVIF